MSISITTPEGIKFFQLCALRGALRLQLLGIKVTKRRSALGIARSMGYKGNLRKVLSLVEADVESMKGVKLNEES